VKAKDLIEENPDDYKPTRKCYLCGGQVYTYQNIMEECENVIFKNGTFWDESPCTYMIMGG
jgi:hypothetical protein